MRARSFALALLFVAFLALLENPPRVPEVHAGASPLSSDWDGTSELVELLRGLGYDVYVVTDWARAYSYVKELSPENVLVIVISPEAPYTEREVQYVLSVLAMARDSASMVVGDEGPYSNRLLRALGGVVAINHRKAATSPEGEPFPVALLVTPSGGVYKLVLNYAAALRINNGVNVSGVTLTGDVVAAHYRAKLADAGRSVEVYVVSDGSLFINHSLRLNSTAYDYRGFVQDLVTSLAPEAESTTILVEGSKYPTVVGLGSLDVSSLLSDPTRLLTLIGVMLHPYVWFPQFADAARSLEAKLLWYVKLESALAIGVSLLFAVLVYKALSRALGLRAKYSGAPDETLNPPYEVDIVVDTELRRRVSTGRVRFNKSDFMPLYALVDSTLRKTVGSGLQEGDVVDRIANLTGLDRRSVLRYVSKMNRLRAKVERRKLLPIVLSWNGVVKEMLEESNSILERLGTSLVKARGVEYVVRRR